MGKPLLEWQLAALRQAGIKDISVVRGYKAFLLKGDFRCIDNPRWAQTNMVSSLFCTPPFNGRTVISYSDIVYKPEYISLLMNSDENISIIADKKWHTLWLKRFESPLEDAESFRSQDGKLISIGGRSSHMEEIQAQYMGLLSLNSVGWETMYRKYCHYSPEEQDNKDMTSLFVDLLKDKVEIAVQFVEGGWYEVDNSNDVMIYENEINNGTSWLHDSHYSFTFP